MEKNQSCLLQTNSTNLGDGKRHSGEQVSKTAGGRCCPYSETYTRGGSYKASIAERTVSFTNFSFRQLRAENRGGNLVSQINTQFSYVKTQEDEHSAPDAYTARQRSPRSKPRTNFSPWSVLTSLIATVACFLLQLSVPASGLAVAVPICPDSCVCPNTTGLTPVSPSSGAFAINCSRLELTSLPEVEWAVAERNVNPDHVHPGCLLYLDMSYNMLTSVDLGWDQRWRDNTSELVLEVISLNFSQNHISSLQVGDLDNYTGVRVLDLSYNRIGNLSGDVFHGLRSLKELHLQHNTLSKLNNDALNHLVSLEILDLSNNKLTSIISLLQGLSSLQYLYLGNNSLHQIIPDVHIYSGSPSLPSLIYLDLANNNIESLQDKAFHEFQALVTLDLRSNAIKTMTKNSFKGMEQLQHLTLDNNELSALRYPVFQNTSLSKLSLSSMPFLHVIEHDAFLGLSKLTSLDLSLNPLLQFLQPSLLKPLSSLKTLNLTQSNLSLLSEITFHPIPNARVILKGNPLACSCINAWLVEEAFKDNSRFVDASSMTCITPTGIHELLLAADIECSELTIHNTTSRLSVRLGSQLLLQCHYNKDDEAVLSWRTPRGAVFYHHDFHPESSTHLLAPRDVQPDAPFHRGHFWHNSSSYYSDLSTRNDRIMILSDGSLYIDYMLRSDTGPYKCQISNAQYNHSAVIRIYLDYNISGEVKVFAFLVGLLCALGFFTLNVVYVVITWTARRLVNKRRREAIRQMLESLNTYKSAQISRIHENYIYQLKRVRNQYHIQRDRLHKNYTVQVARVKRGCSNQVERVRDNYNSKLAQLRDYSSNQIVQIRERANNQIVRIRDYGSNQLEKLRETYKLQHQHVLKLLDTMNLDNCRSVVETECMRTESMIFDTDLFVPEEDRTDSPMSMGESEYNTAASSPSSSVQTESYDGLSGDLARDTTILRDSRVRGEKKARGVDEPITIEMNTDLTLEGGIQVKGKETWIFGKPGELLEGGDHEHCMSVYCRETGDFLELNSEENSVRAAENVLPQQDPAVLLGPEGRSKNSCPPVGLATMEATQHCLASARSDSDSVWEGSFLTPEASPTKRWSGTVETDTSLQGKKHSLTYEDIMVHFMDKGDSQDDITTTTMV